MVSCDHNNDIRMRLITHVISHYALVHKNIETVEFVKFNFRQFAY